MVVVMSHGHANGHVYMKIRLISLISISIRSEQFAVLPQSPRHGLGLGTAYMGPFGEIRSGLCVFNGLVTGPSLQPRGISRK
jgi:hypothetical protein